jgi:DNA-binding transcriptional LysR family regulator
MMILPLSSENCISADSWYAVSMDATKLDWSLFRSFLAVVDTGSLLGAAKRLGSHQPTLSRHIAELERQLGVVLFERTGRGLVPTAAAIAIMDSAREMAVAVEGVRTRLMGVQTAIHGSVRIAASEIVATYLLPAWIERFRHKTPGVQIEVVASNQYSNLLRREADIALRMARPVQSSLIGKKLGELTLGLYASESYLSRHGPPTSIHDLTDHGLVGLDADDSLVRGFQAAGLPIGRDDFCIRTDHQAVYAQMIIAGNGIGVMPDRVGAKIPGLRRVLPDSPAPSLPVWLVVHREIKDNPVIRAVFDGLADAASGIFSSGIFSSGDA